MARTEGQAPNPREEIMADRCDYCGTETTNTGGEKVLCDPCFDREYGYPTPGAGDEHVSYGWTD